MILVLIIIIMIFFFLINIISKYKLVEGVDGVEGVDDNSNTPEIEIDSISEPCTREDVINNNKGNCNVGEGIVSGIKLYDDRGRDYPPLIRDCTCDCVNGYKSIQSDGDYNSCIKSEKISDYQCFGECRNQAKIYSDGEGMGSKEFCNFYENTIELCGKKCTLEGGGTIETDRIIRDYQRGIIVELTRENVCKFSGIKYIDSYIGNDFLHLLHFSLINDSNLFNYDKLVEINENERNDLFSNTFDNQNRLKEELSKTLESDCFPDIEKCYNLMKVNFINKIDVFFESSKKIIYNKEKLDIKLIVTVIFKQLIENFLSENKLSEDEMLKKLKNTIEIFIGFYPDLSNFKEDYFDKIDEIEVEQSKAKDTKDITDNYKELISIHQDPIEDILTRLLCRNYSEKYDYVNSLFNDNFMNICKSDKKCTNNVNFKDNIICKRLKYKKNKDNIKNINNCCDIAWYENVWYNFIDFF